MRCSINSIHMVKTNRISRRGEESSLRENLECLICWLTGVWLKTREKEQIGVSSYKYLKNIMLIGIDICKLISFL